MLHLAKPTDAEKLVARTQFLNMGRLTKIRIGDFHVRFVVLWHPVTLQWSTIFPWDVHSETSWLYLGNTCHKITPQSQQTTGKSIPEIKIPVPVPSRLSQSLGILLSDSLSLKGCRSLYKLKTVRSHSFGNRQGCDDFLFALHGHDVWNVTT